MVDDLNQPRETLRACHRLKACQEIDFAKKLLETGMGLLEPEKDILVGPDGRALGGGWFAVDHTKNRLRLIFDRRPQLN